MILRRSFVASLSALILTLGMAVPAFADNTGILAGKVVDQDGHAIPFASVGIPGARTGGLTDSEGLFRVARINPGKYTVKVNFIGYEPATDEVTIEAGKTTTANYKLKQIVVRREKETVITADRPLVEVRSSATIRSVNSEDIRKLAATNLEQVLEQQAGVSKTNDEIHIRGGRADEVAYIVDGAKTRDLITGQGTSSQLGASAVAEVGVITGGFDAEYGQALSGIVQVRLKEGTPTYHGSLEYMTDHGLGFSGFNTDGSNLQVDGPEPITHLLGLNKSSKLTFLANVNSVLTSTYLDNIQTQPGPDGQKLYISPNYQDSFLGSLFQYGRFFTPRQDNSWAGLYKLTFKPRSQDKLFVSYNKLLQFNQGFGRHLASDISDERDTYPWAWSQRWDHAAVDATDNTTVTTQWTHVFGSNIVQMLQLSLNTSTLNVSVGDKANLLTPWQQYQQPNDDIWKVLGAGTIDTMKAYDLFHDTGDDSIFEDQYSRETTLDYSIDRATRHHDIKFGLECAWQQAQYIDIENPWESDPDTLGSKHDIFTVRPATAFTYLRDKVDYEGFVADIGLRWDVFAPGREAEAAIADTNNVNIAPSIRQGFNESTFDFLGRKVKAHLSPRISVSHPITDRDNFYFNYGEFTQWPAYYYIFSKIGSLSSESFPQIGNLNLDPTVSIQYELGGRHEISRNFAANVSFYQRDTYGYPTLAQSQRIQGTTLSPFAIYLNSDFSRSRGIEVELEKRRTAFFSAKLTYEYSTIRTKASSPNQLKAIEELGGDTREAQVGDEVAYWHRPHQLRLHASWTTGNEQDRPSVLGLFHLPTQFLFSLSASLESGRAYTPSVLIVSYAKGDSTVSVGSSATGSVNSANAAAEFDLDLKMEKSVNFFGRTLRLSLAGTNVLNTGLAKFIDPTTGQVYTDGQGLWSYTEVTDVQKYRHLQIVSDPSVKNPPRNFRLTVGYEF